ncbi:MAG: S1C family serine protease [Oscillospiraceae bacterium]|nr:S1C family serine protease [Oscillospiraceae bacterium]
MPENNIFNEHSFSGSWQQPTGTADIWQGNEARVTDEHVDASAETANNSGKSEERSVAPEWSFRRRGAARDKDTREPAFREAAYCEPSDMMANMYSPGLFSKNLLGEQPRKREALADEPLPEKKGKGRAGRFLWAMCLVVVCAIISAAATYTVMEYRIRAGHHTVVNQVVLGGVTSGGYDGVDPAPIANSPGVKEPWQIYDRALSQVVGIKTEVPTMGFFGTVSTNTIAGSGFIISADGFILTNYHVIEPAQVSGLPISVIMNDGTEYEAHVVGYEQANDVALLRIQATDLDPVVLGNSDNIQVGTRVYAIGNPLGNLVYTMTEGIVSALDRDVLVEGKLINTFQFSAPVNRGNSGGPIYNANGEVIGIVTAKLSRSDVEGIGFAIPINDAIEIAWGLIEYGYIAGRPLIGIAAASVSAAHAEYYGWVVGVYVRAVDPNSAAEKAGVQVGDIIVELGGTEVAEMDSLRNAMRRYSAGDTVMVGIWRSGAYFELEITFDEDLAAGQPHRFSRVPVE